MSNQLNGHLCDVPDGAGCTELWEHLSERRDRTAENDAADGDETRHE